MGPGPIFCCYALKLGMSSFVQNGAWPHFFPISAISLDERLGKAKSSKSLHPFLCILPTLFGREPIYLLLGDEVLRFFALKARRIRGGVISVVKRDIPRTTVYISFDIV